MQLMLYGRLYIKLHMFFIFAEDVAVLLFDTQSQKVSLKSSERCKVVGE